MKTIRSFILLMGTLFFAVTIPTGIFAEEGTVPQHAQNAMLMSGGRLALSAITAYVDGQIEGMARLLGTMAETKEVKSGNWDRMKPLLVEVKRHSIPSVIFFAHTDGSYFTVERGAVDRNIKDRPYFSMVMSGNVSFGQLVISRSTGKYVAIAAVPVRDKGRVVGLLGASIYLEELNEQVLKVLQLPENVIFYVLDQEGITALHFWKQYIFQDPAKLDSPSLARAVKEIMTKREGYVSYEFMGKPRDLIYMTSAITGWHYVLGVMREE
ncbi:MAG: hypothetical protein AMS17_11615 [Spirochaetes bacterium DG_61]|jgi:hypothetical protein|nr:MAG: hypothetical protein AMS17_11615 [Spirochaetes bacterium DG_61]